MKAKIISDLLLKVAGIMILILSIPNIHYYVLIYSQFQEKTLPLFLSTVIAPNIIPILLGIFLFTKPGKITGKIVENSGDPINELQDFPYVKVEQLCLAVIGYYLLATSSAEIIFQIANFVQAKASIPYRSASPPSNSLIFTPDFISILGQLGVSLWLIFGAKGIVKTVTKFRSTT